MYAYTKNIILLSMFLLIGCDDTKPSKPITLYKNDIKTGNSIVTLVRWSDPDGVWAMKECENLRDLYIKTDKINYICSSINDKKYKPVIKWNAQELD